MPKRSIRWPIFAILVLFAMGYPAKAASLADPDLCRAGLSTVLNVKVEEIEIFKNQKNIYLLRFPKQERNIPTLYKCQIKGTEILWATETGGWRNTSLESKITFEQKDNILLVMENHLNGSVFQKTFDIQKLTGQ